MTAPDPDSPPIFVVGTGRSGTTLLRMMLCAHPRIHLTHEGSFYIWQALFPKKHDGEALLRHYVQSASFRWLHVDPRPLLDALPKPVSREEAHRFFTLTMQAASASYGKPRWGDKTPNHANHLDLLYRDHPDARVVRIVRDPRATVRSFQRMPWATRSLLGATALCEMERKAVAPFRDRLLEVRLEDLSSDPRGTMEAVLDHVGEPWDDAVLAHHEHLPQPDDLPPVPWFQGAKKPLRPPREKGSPRDPAEERLLEWLHRRSLAEHGYAPTALAQEPSWFAKVWRALRDLPEFLHALGAAGRLARIAQDPARADGPEQEAALRRLNPAAWAAMPELTWPRAPALPPGWDARWSAPQIEGAPA